MSSSNFSEDQMRGDTFLRFSDGPRDVRGVIPSVLALGTKRYAVDSWQSVFEKVCREMFAVVPDRFKTCLMNPDFLWLDRRSGFYKKSVQLSTFCYAELSGNPTLCYERICQLLSFLSEVEGGIVGRTETSNVKCKPRNRQSAEDVLVSAWERESKGKIGRYVRLAMSYVLTKHLLSRHELSELSTYEGTAKAIDTYLKKCPLVSDRQFADNNGIIRCWQEPILVDGRPLYVNKEWYEPARPKFNAWLLPVLRMSSILASSNDNVSEQILEWENLSKGKIGKFAYLALSYVLEQQLLTREEFEGLCTAQGALKTLGFSMTHSPLFGMREIVDSNGHRRSWTQPAFVGGRKVFMNQQWYELHRTKFLVWLKMVLCRGKHCPDMLPDEADPKSGHLSESEIGSACEAVGNDAIAIQIEDGDGYDAKLDEWGEESL